MPSKKYHLPKETITLTDSFEEFDKYYGISSDERVHMNDFFMTLNNNAPETSEINAMYQKFPGNVFFKSLLAANYLKEGKELLSYNLISSVLTKYPDYLQAKQVLANYYFALNKHEEADALFDHFTGCAKLLTKRKKITYFEFIIYVLAGVDNAMYYSDLDGAFDIIQNMENIPPLRQNYFSMMDHLDAFMDIEEEELEESENNYLYKIFPKGEVPGNFDTKEPEFNHPEIKIFYKKAFNWDAKTVRKILSLPRETAIADFITVIHDLEDRFFYFQESKYSGGKEMFKHVCNFTEAFGAEEVIPVLLKFLKHNENVVSIWMRLEPIYLLWPTFTVAGKNSLKLYIDFLFEPGIVPSAKEAVLFAIYQIQMHYPYKYREVVNTYLTIFNKINADGFKENVFNDSLLIVLCNDALDLGDKNLESAIKVFYNNPKYKIIFNCSFSEFRKIALEEAEYEMTLEIKNVYQKYIPADLNDLNEELADESYLDDIINEDDYNRPSPQPLSEQTFKKISRNANCPCGSGKKFKHCHGKFPDIINN